MLSKLELLSLLRESKDLPSIPLLVSQIMEVTSTSSFNADDISCVVEKDMAASAMILKMANSLVYNKLGIPVSDLTRAIARIGINETVNIATSMSLLNGVSFPSSLKRMEELWIHSYSTAVLARKIGISFDPGQDKVDHNLLFMAGLFHEVGRVAIASVIDTEYFFSPVGDLRGRLLVDEEIKKYGIDHAEAGFILLDAWGMPNDLCTIVKLCGSSELTPYNTACCICSFASGIATDEFDQCSSFSSVLEKVPSVMKKIEPSFSLL